MARYHIYFWRYPSFGIYRELSNDTKIVKINDMHFENTFTICKCNYCMTCKYSIIKMTEIYGTCMFEYYYINNKAFHLINIPRDNDSLPPAYF